MEKFKIIAICFFCGLTQLMAQTQKSYNQSEYIWDLSEIYSTDELWEDDFKLVKNLINANNFQSRTEFNNSEELAELLDEISRVRTKVSRVAYYAILRWEEGKVAKGEELLAKGEQLLINFETILANAEQNILNIGKQNLQSWLHTNKKLFKHRHWLNLIIDQSNHRTNPETEVALRKVRNWISSSIGTYWELQSLKALWPQYKDEEGKAITLNRSAYRKIRRSNDIGYKKEGTRLYYNALKDMSNMMAELYTNKIRAESELADLRGFDDGIDANWFRYAGVPKGGYKIMLESARNNKRIVQEYAKLRAKVLGKDKLEYIDFYTTPKSLKDFEYSFDQSMNIADEGSKLLGVEFQENMKIALTKKNWMHLADVPKTANYHLRPPSGDIHPYFILKYKPNIIRSRTLVGGLFDLASSIPGIGTDGTDVLENPASSIYGNGMIYVGDLLHDEVLAERIQDKGVKMGYLIESLEFLRTFFRHVIHTELDARVQKLISNNQILDGEAISNEYLKILRNYYGHDQGVMEIPEYMKYDWMTETYVMFLPKYEHQFWSPAIASAAAIISKSKTGDRKVKKLLKQDYVDGRYDAYSVLKSGGIGLMTKEAYAYIFYRMLDIISEVNILLKN